jgi:hypothetical protein
MSPQSQAIFDQALYKDYPQSGNAEALLAAAHGHIGASRPLDVLLAEYATAMEGQERHTPGQAAAAQAIADEMVPVRAAHAVVNGYVSQPED